MFVLAAETGSLLNFARREISLVGNSIQLSNIICL